MLGTKLHIDPVEEFGGGVSPWWLSALLLLIALIYCLYKGEKDGTKIFLIILLNVVVYGLFTAIGLGFLGFLIAIAITVWIIKS